jgi:hypothetical protein
MFWCAVRRLTTFTFDAVKSVKESYTLMLNHELQMELHFILQIWLFVGGKKGVYSIKYDSH